MPDPLRRARLGQDLAVQLDTRELEAMDKLRVADPVKLGGGTDADDPKQIETGASSVAAADVGKT